MDEEDMLYVTGKIIIDHEQQKRKLWVYVFQMYLEVGVKTASSQADQAVELFERSCPPMMKIKYDN